MSELIYLLPEIFLLITSIGLLASEVTYHQETSRLILPTALVGLVGALIQNLATYQYGPAHLFNESLSIDGLSLYGRFVLIFCAILTVLLGYFSKELPARRRAEFFALVIIFTAALCLSIAAVNLLLIFITLQAAFWISYILLAFGKRSVVSTEAAIKGLIFGTVGGAFYLFGATIIFGKTKTLQLAAAHQFFLSLGENQLGGALGLIAFLLLFLSLGVVFYSFPMQLWVPDALEGAPTPTAALLSTSLPLAGFIVALRLLTTLFGQPSLSEPWRWEIMGRVNWPEIVALASALTMLMGGLLSILQQKAKRLISYLVVTQAGFFMMALVVIDKNAVSATLLSFFFQSIAMIGAFAVLSFFIDRLGTDHLSGLRGAFFKSIPEGVAFVVFLTAFVGGPGSPGFIGRFALIQEVVDHGWGVLGFFALVAYGLNIYAALRFVLCLVSTAEDFEKVKKLEYDDKSQLLIFALLIPTVFGAILADPLLLWVERSIALILW